MIIIKAIFHADVATLEVSTKGKKKKKKDRKENTEKVTMTLSLTQVLN